MLILSVIAYSPQSLKPYIKVVCEDTNDGGEPYIKVVCKEKTTAMDFLLINFIFCRTALHAL